MGSVRGRVVRAEVRGDVRTVGPPPGTLVRLRRPDGTGEVQSTAGPAGDFEFQDVPSGWYILECDRRMVKGIRVEAEASIDEGLLTLPGPVFGLFEDFQKLQGVFTVCEALDKRESLNWREVIVVGIFKSGMDETLRLDCSTQLRTGDIGWPSAIGLTKVGNVPDELRGEVEKKRQEILSSAPPEAPLRPERVVGLYGRFVSLAGLTGAPCCTAAVETTFPPARLFGVNETDLRVIR